MGPSGPNGIFSSDPLKSQGDNSAHANWAPAWAPMGPKWAPAWAPLGPGGRLFSVFSTDPLLPLRLGTGPAAPVWTLSHGTPFGMDSLSRSCSGVNLSTSHQRWPSGQGTPNRW